MKPRFELLNSLHKGAAKNPDELIHILREQARKLLSKNNEVVEKIWNIDLAMTKPQDAEYKSTLMKQREVLLQELKIENYKGNINDLLEEIKNLELETHGHSDIGLSPFNL